MNNYTLKIRKNDSYYCNCLLKADTREEAIKQSNEIMNRFELEFKAVIEEQKPDGTRRDFIWFN